MSKRKKSIKQKISNKQFLGLFIVGFGGAIAISLLLGSSAVLPNYLKSQAIPTTDSITGHCSPTRPLLIDTISNNNRTTGTVADTLGAAKNSAIKKMELAIKDECKTFRNRDDLALVCPQAETACPACEPNVGNPYNSVTCSAGSIKRNPKSLTADNWDITTYESQNEEDNSYIASLKNATFSAPCLCRTTCRRTRKETTYVRGSDSRACGPGTATFETSLVNGTSAAEYPNDVEATSNYSSATRQARKAAEDAAKADATSKLASCPGGNSVTPRCGVACTHDRSVNPNPSSQTSGKVICSRIYSQIGNASAYGKGALPRYEGLALGCSRTCIRTLQCKNSFNPGPTNTP